MLDRVGQQLGNYRLLRPIGQGGFADVYLGEHVYLNTQAAIKVLQMRLSDEDKRSFLEEARTIAHLKHPHIVRVLDYDVEDDTPFLVMDYAPGGTLRKRHPKGTPLPLTMILSYVKQVASALQYAHDQRVIHRPIARSHTRVFPITSTIRDPLGTCPAQPAQLILEYIQEANCALHVIIRVLCDRGRNRGPR